jgi:transcriptional regulator with XRE-family HTH domain
MCYYKFDVQSSSQKQGVTMIQGYQALAAMDFPERLAALRRERSLTQQALADAVGIHVSQLRRYEAGQSQPTLDVIRKLAVALSVSADLLVFDKDERGPDDEFRLQFEAVGRLDPHERTLVREVLDSIISRHEARRLFVGRAGEESASA